MQGFNVLPGNTRVRTQSGLVRLDQLSGSGPQGPASPKGDQGDPGEDGVVDTSQFYTKNQVNFQLVLKQNALGTHVSTGARIWDQESQLLRNIMGKWHPNLHLHGPDRPFKSRQ